MTSNEKDLNLKQIYDTISYNKDKVIKIGNIKVKYDNNNKLYNVYNDENILLVKDIFLYEAAYVIASYLYRGLPTYSFKFISFINTMRKYEKFILDAELNIQNFHKYKANLDYEKMDIENAKFEENKNKAIFHKNSIIKEYDKLGK